jgi:D-lactate dehydrogenase (cytochrome)
VDPVETGVYRVEPQSDGMKAVRDTKAIAGEYQDYLKDESNVHAAEVSAIFFPRSIEHICAVLREAGERAVPVTVSGARTGICAGAVPGSGGYVVSLEKMNRMLSIDRFAEGFELRSECGLRLSELSARLKSKDFPLEGDAAQELQSSKISYFYPPDPTETTATLGGTVATNASGARTLFYGPTREYVVGLEIVLPEGNLLRIRRGEMHAEGGVFRIAREGGSPLIIPAPTYEVPDTKHSAGLYSRKGMDLIDLFIGSEGILGIIATVTVRLLQEPSGFASGVAFFPTEDASLSFVELARSGGMSPLALEYFDSDALLMLEEVRVSQGPTSEIPAIPDFGAAVYFESAIRSGQEDGFSQVFAGWRRLIQECGGDPSVCWGAMEKRDLLRLKVFRHSLPERVNMIIAQKKLKNPRIHKVGTDMAVPDNALEEMVHFYRQQLRQEQLRTVIFGHIGNNHLHVNIIPESDEELARAKALYKKFAQKAVSLGGSVSAEHGIGKLKKEYLLIQYPEQHIEQMRAIKLAIDPRRILNPGDMI